MVSTKTLISLFLIPLFIGKLLVVDASVLNLLSQGKVTVVKTNCKKKTSGSDSYDFEQYVDSKNSVIEIGSFCTPQFNFNVFSWSLSVSEDMNMQDDQLTSRLSYLYLDSHSPPPRLV